MYSGPLRAGENFLKRTLAYLYCTKYKKIEIFHSDVEKPLSNGRSHNRFLMDHGLCLKMDGYVFSIVLHRLILLY